MSEKPKTKKTNDSFWEGDNLNRQKDADYLINFLIKRTEERATQPDKGSFVLNLDAPWGHGKTYFLTRMKQQLANQGHLVAYINAWEDDHAKDPLLAVIAEIDTIIQEHLKKNEGWEEGLKERWKKGWKKVASSVFDVVVTTTKHVILQKGKQLVGEGIEEIQDALQGDQDFVTDSSDIGITEITSTSEESDLAERNENKDYAKESEIFLKLIDKQLEGLLNEFRTKKTSKQTFQDSLQSFLNLVQQKKGIELPFFILIDELDRCRPTYTVEMLERIKHLFNIHNIVFILATDTSQLRHVVRGVYGGDFDSTRYLLRFFDRTYMFMEADKENFVKHLFKTHNIDNRRLSSPMNMDNAEFFTKMMLYFDLGLRDIEQCFDMFHDFYTSWEYKGMNIQMTYLLPLICTFQQGNLEIFEFWSQNDPTDAEEDKKYQQILERHNLNEINKKKHKITFRINARDKGHSCGSIGSVTLYHLKRSTQTLEISSLITRFIAHAYTPLETEKQRHNPQIAAQLERTYKDESSFEVWLDLQAENELSILHPKALTPPDSILRHYPNLVKSSGRLSLQSSE